MDMGGGPGGRGAGLGSRPPAPGTDNGGAPGLATAPVRASGGARTLSFDGSVEAVRQTVVAARVPGAVVAIEVRVGEAVRPGQLLVRLDARAAEQTAAASDAQVQATRASLQVATRELGRQLFQKEYIGRAALERAEAQFSATKAQLDAQLAQAGAAKTQSGFHVVLAPYAGVVAEVPVALGDMAMPGRPLLTLYDPDALRVTAALPQTVAARASAPKALRIELPGLPPDARWVVPVRTTVLPTADAATHTVQVRLDLPAGAAAVSPGTFARVWLSAPVDAGAERLYVPARAVVRRAEMTGVYVVAPNGRPVLRQVRLGPTLDADIEVPSGVAAGERVALEPQVAARVRRGATRWTPARASPTAPPRRSSRRGSRRCWRWWPS
jgi:multidrug efflux system membrane fusion protein